MTSWLFPPPLGGIPLRTSELVPEGQVIMGGGAAWFHSRLSARARMRYPHGRRNGRRRWKVRYVRYQPDLDRVMALAAEQDGER